MKSENTSQQEEEARRTKGHSIHNNRKAIPSPYEQWWHVESLELEARRLLSLPPPTMHARIVMRWRKKQVWLINVRIKQLLREAQMNGE